MMFDKPTQEPKPTSSLKDYHAFKSGLFDERDERELSVRIYIEKKNIRSCEYTYITDRTLTEIAGNDVLTIFTTTCVIVITGINLESGLIGLDDHTVKEIHPFDPNRFAPPDADDAMISRIEVFTQDTPIDV